MRPGTYVILSLVLFSAVFLAGTCADQESRHLQEVSASTIKNNHGYREKMTILLPPEFNIFEQVKRYQPLEDYLTTTLKIDFKFKVVESYGAVIRELENNRAEGAFLGSLNYLLARKRAGIEVIARPQWLDGSSVYTGLIFARKDGQITRDIGTWRGKTFAIVHQATTAGYLFPQWYLLKAGILNWDVFFKKIIIVGSHDATIFMVLNGEAELGVAKNTVFKQLAKENPLLEQSLVILAESVEVPSNALGIRKDVPPNVKKEIKETLLRMDSSPFGREKLKTFGALKFVDTTDQDYEPVNVMLRDLQQGSNNPLFTPF